MWKYVFISSGKIPKSDLTVSHSVFHFKRNCQIMSQSGTWLHSPSNTRVPAAANLPTLRSFRLQFQPLYEGRDGTYDGSNLPFPQNPQQWTSFHVLISLCISSLVKRVGSTTLPIFKLGYLLFYCCMIGPFHNLDSDSIDTCYWDICSLAIACPFIFFTISFKQQKFLFWWSIIYHLLYVSCILCSI